MTAGRHQVDHALVAMCLIGAGYFVARCHAHHHRLARKRP